MALLGSNIIQPVPESRPLRELAAYGLDGPVPFVLPGGPLDMWRISSIGIYARDPGSGVAKTLQFALYLDVAGYPGAMVPGSLSPVYIITPTPLPPNPGPPAWYIHHYPPGLVLPGATALWLGVELSGVMLDAIDVYRTGAAGAGRAWVIAGGGLADPFPGGGAVNWGGTIYSFYCNYYREGATPPGRGRIPSKQHALIHGRNR